MLFSKSPFGTYAFSGLDSGSGPFGVEAVCCCGGGVELCPEICPGIQLPLQLVAVIEEVSGCGGLFNGSYVLVWNPDPQFRRWMVLLPFVQCGPFGFALHCLVNPSCHGTQLGMHASLGWWDSPATAPGDCWFPEQWSCSPLFWYNSNIVLDGTGFTCFNPTPCVLRMTITA